MQWYGGPCFLQKETVISCIHYFNDETQKNTASGFLGHPVGVVWV